MVDDLNRRRGGVIYGLFAEDDESRTIRYVGKTVRDAKRRLQSHLGNARSNQRTPVAKWIASHGFQIDYVVLAECATYDELNEAEMRLIEQYGTRTTQGGLNCTAGGDGSVGWVNGPEAIEKIRQKALGRKHSREHIQRSVESRRGWSPSAETRALWSKQRTGRKFTEEALATVRATRALGEASGRSKLVDADVAKIKALLWDASSQKEIADAYGVSQGCISSINTEETWTHIPWPDDRERTPYVRSRSGAILSDDQVREIRHLWDSGEYGESKLADKLGLSRSQVRRVGLRERYQHVPEADATAA